MNYLLTVFISLFAGVIGYIVNEQYLSKIYSFAHFNEMIFNQFDINKFFAVVNGFISAYGYKSGDKLLSIGILHNMTAAVVIFLLVIAIRKCLKKSNKNFEECFLTYTFISAIIIFTLLYSFSSMHYANRYNIPIFVLSIPIVIQYIENEYKGNNWKKVGIAVLGVCFVICAFFNYEVEKATITQEKSKVVSEMLKNNCNYGYASFWNANVLTELSNGKIDVHIWGDDISGVEDVNQTFGWLHQKKYDKEIPSGKIFCLFDTSQLNCSLAKKMASESLAYDSEMYKAYIYNSYEDLLKAISSYKMNVDSPDWLQEGNAPDKKEARVLYNGGISYGPYITLYGGKYKVTCEGEGLQHLTFDVFSGALSDGKQNIHIYDIKQSENEITYLFELHETIEKVETRFFNNTDYICVIKSLTIQKE